MLNRHGVTESLIDAPGVQPPMSASCAIDNGDAALVVGQLWDAYERRAWTEAEVLFHPQAVLLWPVTGERIDGAGGIIRLNAIYPEGWSIKPQRIVQLSGDRAYSIVRVDLPPNTFFAVSFFEIHDGRIAKLEEYWSTVESPPPWRTADRIPGLSRIA